MPTFIQITGSENPFDALNIDDDYANTFLVDIDDDGDLDLITGSFAGQLLFFQNDGSSIAPLYLAGIEILPEVDTSYDYTAPAFADLDSDGDFDLILGEGDGRLFYYLNNGTSSEPEFAKQTGSNNPFGSFSSTDYTVTTVGDVDGDGLLDLVVGDGDGVVHYLRNVGNAQGPLFLEQSGSANPFNAVTAEYEARPTLGDVDGDGDLDLVVGDGEGFLRYVENIGSSTDPIYVERFDADNPFDGYETDYYPAPNLADVDGDGDLDLLVGTTDGLFLYYENQGNVPVNRPPVAVNDQFVVSENSALEGNVLNANPTTPDSDPDGDPLTVFAVNGQTGSVGTQIPLGQGLLTVNANGSFSFNTNGGYESLGSGQSATETFTYLIQDVIQPPTSGGSINVVEVSGATATVTITIQGVNDAPAALNDTAQTSLNTGVNVSVLTNDTDIDGGTLRVVAVSPGANGSTTVRSDQVSVRYTPNTGFSGFDTFNYTVSDGFGGTATASVGVVVASITGSNGNDVPLGTQQADFVLALDGNDRVLTHGGADFVDGGRGADTITGGAGADTLLGGEGADTFLATSAELAGDQIDGGAGTDTLVITNAPASIPANFSFTNLELISYSGALLVEHGSLVDLSSLTLAPGSSNLISGGTANSRITGTASADTIIDSAGNDDLRGAAGNDTIYGGFGQDTINGGTGNDALYGGSASAANDFVRDIFVFNTPLNAATNVDQIFGFQANSQDRIALDISIFSAITGGASLGLDAGEFLSVNGGNAQDGNDFIIFDPLTGNLFYDRDGIGEASKVLFATLVGLNGTLDVTDFGVAESPF